MKQYPRMLYRPGTALQWGGMDLDTRVVTDDAECTAAMSRGWTEIDELLRPRDPLDHDGDGHRGGSMAGYQSTRAKGARRKRENGQ